MKNLVNILLSIIIFVAVVFTNIGGEIHHAGMLCGDQNIVGTEYQEEVKEKFYAQILDSVDDKYWYDYSINHKDTIKLSDADIMNAYHIYAKYLFERNGKEDKIPSIKIMDQEMPEKFLDPRGGYHCYIGDYPADFKSRSHCVHYDKENNTILVYKNSIIFNADLINGVTNIMWAIGNNMSL